MNRCITWATALMIFWSAAVAQGRAPAAPDIPPALVTNGCGSGRFGFLVPEKTWISQCNFEASCNAHDICYAKCLEGGALQGNPSCNVKADKQRRRAVCDVSLQRDIIFSHPNTPMCGMYASLYRFAVQVLGEQYFHGYSISGAYIEEPLAEFLEHLRKHPQSFDNADVERAFKTLATAGLQDGYYTVTFTESEPSLRVWHLGKLVIDLKGKRTAQ